MVVRVLLVLTSSEPRGAQVEGSTLARELRRRDLADVETVALTGVSGNDDVLNVETLGDRPTALGTLLKLRRRARAADIVVAYGSSTLPACALSLPGGPPFVYRSIGDPAMWLRNRLHQERTGVGMRRAAHVVALWDGAAASLRRLYRLPEAGVSVIPNGRPADRFLPGSAPRQSSTASSVLYLGSLAAEKRIDRTIGAISRIEGLQLQIAGTGPDERRLRDLAEDLAPGRVEFLGHVPDPVPLLRANGALVLTSRTEGIPGVAIEALLCGTPVVAPNIGGIAQVVEAGVGGLLTDGSVEETTTALRAVLEPGFGDPIAARRVTADRFSFDRVAEQWAALLQSIVLESHS